MSSINRRQFIAFGTAASAASMLPACAAVREAKSTRRTSRARVGALRADVVVIGGGLGGCAAALAALRAGRSVILSEETDWIGGQSTAQAVPPDENQWVETFGATKLYQDYRNRIRDYYRRNYPLTDAARAEKNLNPGNGGVSRICHEPRVSLAALLEMLAPHASSGRLTLLTRHLPVCADTQDDRVRGVVLQNLECGDEVAVVGDYFLDATETGALLPMAGVEHITGAESNRDTGELHATETARPDDMQAFTVCFPMEYCPGENHVADPPRDYAYWKAYVPKLTPAWSGPLISLRTIHPVTLQERNQPFNPEDPNAPGWWKYRRILDPANFTPGFSPGGVTLVNWPQNDYLDGNLIGVSAEAARKHVDAAKQLSLSLFHWLQTEAPRPDGKQGWPGLRLRPDMTGTTDGLAKHPYIRESRRIRAEFTVLEQHVGKDARAALTKGTDKGICAEQFPDTVGIGFYRIDLHPSTGGDNYIDIDSLPFQIPLGALLPQRVQNLLPACKNLGVTHLTNGCYRLHPVEWNIGESAGALAAFCLDRKAQPRQVRADAALLAEFQSGLNAQGIPLQWPEEARFRT
jgi:hypothetical protein